MGQKAKETLLLVVLVVVAVFCVRWLLDQLSLSTKQSRDYTDAQIGRLSAATGMALQAVRNEQRQFTTALLEAPQQQPEPPAFGAPKGKVGFAENDPEQNS
jgi:hypothetical protein